jgi:Concanavalin A-like lectin/glucanases superfamily
MGGCVRASSVAAIALAASLGGACAPHELRVVDPKDPLLDGLVGWWRFDDGMGSTTARDASGHGNDGALVDVDGSSMSTWPPSQQGTSIELGGAGYVNVQPSASIDAIVDQITVSAWIRFEGDVPVDFVTALSREIGNTIDQHYHISINKEAVPVLFITTRQGMGPTGYRLDGPAPVPRFMWTHLAGTYDGAAAILYVDGVNVQSRAAAGTFAPETNPLVLGGNGNGPANGVTERFAGQIDEVMLYKRALSADEIHQLYAGALFAR